MTRRGQLSSSDCRGLTPAPDFGSGDAACSSSSRACSSASAEPSQAKPASKSLSRGGKRERQWHRRQWQWRCPAICANFPSAPAAAASHVCKKRATRGESERVRAVLLIFAARTAVCSRSGDKWPVSLVAVIMLKCLPFCMHAEEGAAETGSGRGTADCESRAASREQRNGTSEGDE